MTDFSQRTGTGNNVLITDYDQSKTFLWNKRTAKGTIINALYVAKLYKQGTLLGRVGSSKAIVALKSAAVDGSQYPLGILLEDTIIDSQDSLEVTFAVAGDVVESKVVLDGTDTLDTLIGSRTIRDRIGADTVGIKLVQSTEQTRYDN